MERRSYSESDKASALAMLQANGGNVKGTARELKMPTATLRKWRDGLGVNEDVSLKCDEKKKSLTELFEEVAHAYLSRALEAEAVAESKGKEAVIAAATAVDKFRLLKGEPTEVTRNEVVTYEPTPAGESVAARILRDRGALN